MKSCVLRGIGLGMIKDCYFLPALNSMERASARSPRTLASHRQYPPVPTSTQYPPLRTLPSIAHYLQGSVSNRLRNLLGEFPCYYLAYTLTRTWFWPIVAFKGLLVVFVQRSVLKSGCYTAGTKVAPRVQMWVPDLVAHSRLLAEANACFGFGISIISQLGAA